MSDSAGKKTPLYDQHVRTGAKIVPFGGWLMPVQYTSIVEEHRAVRRDVGMFDISHMGQFLVEGANAGAWLNLLLTNNTEKLEIRQGQYTFLLNERGGIIDDLIAYRIDSEKFLLVVNASRAEEDFAWFEKHRDRSAGPVVRNRSAEFAGLAIQGPRVTGLFDAVLSKTSALPPRNRIIDVDVDRMPISIARTGYTGEDGVEVFFRASDAEKIWKLFVDTGQQFGLRPCGLGARDTLRLEMCYPLNGSDLSPERNPLDAGLGFFVDLNKPKFVGRDALLTVKQNGSAEKLVAFRMTGKGPPPRPHYSIFRDDTRLGEVTSGTLSPSLGYGIGMGYVAANSSTAGTELEIEIRGGRFPATIEKKPLYKKRS